jgi:hypothetical protein
MDVFLWHVLETPIPPLSPAGVVRLPSHEEEICSCSLLLVIQWVVSEHPSLGTLSTMNPGRILLDKLWL